MNMSETITKLKEFKLTLSLGTLFMVVSLFVSVAFAAGAYKLRFEGIEKEQVVQSKQIVDLSKSMQDLTLELRVLGLEMKNLRSAIQKDAHFTQ